MDGGLRESIEELGRRGSLEREIGMLRMALERAVVEGLEGGDVDKLATTMSRLTNAIERVVKTQRMLEEAVVDEREALIHAALEDIGVGEVGRDNPHPLTPSPIKGEGEKTGDDDG